MTPEEFAFLVELALAVHEMAPPDRQRSISRKMADMEAAHRRDEPRMMPAPLPPRFFAALSAVLDRAHAALRTVDALDNAALLDDPTMERVCDAIAAIEEFARERGIKLSEFR